MNKQGFKGMFKFNLSISRLVLTFMMLLIVVVGGTFAWFTFSSRQSALVLTIGNINNTQITLSPYQVREDNIVPTSKESILRDNAYKVYSDVTVSNTKRSNTVTLYYKINDTASMDVLKTKGLRYTIVNTSTGEELKTGDFIGISGGELVIYEENVVSAGATTYRVYLWVDSSVGNQNDIAGKTLDVELNGAIGSVKIRGTNTYGETLIADITDFQNNIVGDSATGSDYTYQWYSNDSNSTSGGTAISGATSRTYKIGEGLVGKYIYVVAKVSRGGSIITYTDITDASSKDVDGDYSNNTAQVACRPLNKITAGSKSKVYDGAELKDATCTAETLLTGHSITCTMTEGSKITNVGSVVNKIATYTIKNGTTTIDSNTSMTNYCPVGSVVDGTLEVTKASCSCTLTVDPSTLVRPTHDLDGKATLVCVDTKSSSRYPDGNRYITSNNTNVVTVGTLTHTPSDFTNNSQITESEATYNALTTGIVTLTGGSEAGSNYNACLVENSVKTVNVRNNQFTVIYYYKEAMSGDYDIAGSSTHTYEATTGNKLTSAATLGIPTSAVTPYGWKFAGWSETQDSVTIGFNDEADVSTLTDVEGAVISLYAVYKRTIKFKSGIGGSTSNGEFEQKWNRETITSGTTPSTSQTTDIGNCWNEGGYRYDTTAGTLHYGFSTSITPEYNIGSKDTTDEKVPFYAVYSRNVNFYSGQGNTNNPVVNSQYYNSSGNASSITGISATAISGWTHAGWTYSTDSNASELTGSSITPSVSADCNLYAIYSKNYSFIFYHGVNKAKNTTISGTVYYNTNTTAVPTVATVTAPTAAVNTDIADWKELGYRDDTDTPATASPATDSVANVVEIAFATSVTGTIGENKYYAVYSRDYSFIFYHGINKASNTTITGTVYYNTNTTAVPTKVTVTAPTAANNTNITNWTELGYRADTTAGDKAIAWSASVEGNIGTKEYYAVYKRTVEKIYGLPANITTTNQELFYNSNNTMTALTDASAESNGWEFSSWTTGTTADSTTAFTVSSTSGTVYARYSRTITLYSGYDDPSTTSTDERVVSTQTQYYNASNETSSLTTVLFPDETNKQLFNTTPASLIQYGWSLMGWVTSNVASGIDDASILESAPSYSSSSLGSNCPVTSSVVTYYALYSRSIHYKEHNNLMNESSMQYYTSYSSSSYSKVRTVMSSLSTNAPCGWSPEGFRVDTSASAADIFATYAPGVKTPLGHVNNNETPTPIYVVYIRTITFKSGSTYTTENGTQQNQYYNAYGTLSEITIPTTPSGTIDSNWEFFGYSDSEDYDSTKTLYEKGASVTLPISLENSCNTEDGTYNVLYAIYHRTQNVTFYSGYDNPSTTSKDERTVNVVVGEAIYSPENNIYSTEFSVPNIPAAEVMTSYGWSTEGWNTSGEANLTNVVLFGESLDLNFDSSVEYKYYAVYKRTLTAKSGQNTSQSTHTATQYFNSSGNITTPALPEATGNINTTVTKADYSSAPTMMTGWLFVGWRNDTTVDEPTINSSDELISSTSTPKEKYNSKVKESPKTLYAVYSRTVYLYTLGRVDNSPNGECLANSDNNKYSATQYYSTAKPSPESLALPTTSSGGDFSPNVGISDNVDSYDYDFVGWRYDDNHEAPVAGMTQFVGDVTMTGSSNFVGGYAIYIKESTIRFVHGLKSSNTVIEYNLVSYYNGWTGCGSLFRDQYHKTSITTPTAAQVNTISTYGWEPQGFTASDVPTDYYNSEDFDFSESVGMASPLDVPLGVTLTFYTDYSRPVYAYGPYPTDIDDSYVATQSYWSADDLPTYLRLPDEDICWEFERYNTDFYPGTCEGVGLLGWNFLGWRDDTTAGNNEMLSASDVGEVTEGFYWRPEVNSDSTTASAVYNRTVTANFYYGVNGDSDTQCANDGKCINKTGTAWYNTSGNYPNTISITSPTKAENTDITGWTELGYRNDTTDGAKEYDFNKSVTANVDSISKYYAVYSKDYSTAFYHGLDASGNNTLTGTVYYNTATDSLPTTTKVTAPTSVPALGNCWTAKGYKKENTTADTTGLISFGTANIEVAISGSKTVDTNSTKFYAIYERSVTFKSGLDEGTTHSPTRTQYYNSANTDSSATGENVSSISTFTGTSINPVGSVTTGWTFKGWRDDKTASTPEYTGSSISPYANVNCILYAVYERSVTFKSGKAAATTHSPARTQYYNSANTNSSYTGENVSAISTFTATAISGWTFKGWRDDDTKSAAEYTGSSISPYANGGNIIYAMYDRSYSVKFYHGIDGDSDTSCSNSAKCINKTGTEYYNSAGSSLTTTFSVAVPTAAQTTNITGWTELGYRYDTTADDKELSFGGSLTELSFGTTYEYYAVYSRTLSAHTGLNEAYDFQGTQYYSSSGDVSVLVMPTDDEDYVCNGSFSSSSDCGSLLDSIEQWTYLGWRDDTTATVADTVTFYDGTSHFINPDSGIVDPDYYEGVIVWSPSVTSTATTAYAVYSRQSNAFFFHGNSGRSDCQYNNNCIEKVTTVYYNSSASSLPTVTTITAPTADETSSITNWNKLGYGYSGSTAASISFGGTISISVDYYLAPIGNTFYAIYGRDYSVKFYHGIDGDSNTGCTNSAKCINVTGTSIYNSYTNNTIFTQADEYFNITSPTADQNTNITGWTEIGYSIDTAAGGEDEDFNASISIPWTELGRTYYAVYERTVTAYSGINKATTHTATQYYNTSGEIEEMFMPDDDTTGGNDFSTSDENDDNYITTIGNEFNFIGWCDGSSTTGNCFEYGPMNEGGEGDSVFKWTPAVDDTTPYAYAIYEREIVAWSGEASGAYHTPEVEHKGNQYYNSYGTISTMTMPKTNSPGSFTTTNTNLASISGWTHNGWRNDRTSSGVSTLSTNSSGDYVYTPAVSATPSIMYAIYIINYEARFYMGVNGDSDTNCTNTSKCVKRSGSEYYNSYSTSLPATESVSAPSKSDTTTITNWTKDAYSASPSSYDPAVEFSSSISVSLGTTTNFYAIYYRNYDVRFYYGQDGDSDTNCTNTSKCIRYTDNVSYNSSTNTLPTTVPSAITVPTKDETTGITNWTKEGYRADTTAADNTIAFSTASNQVTVTPSLGNTYYYAVYSRSSSATFYHGVNKASNTPKSKTTYYNTTSSSLPTETTITAATAAQTTDISGWTELGYRDDTDNAAKEITFGGSITVSLGSSTTYYAVYSADASAIFYYGENKAGNTPITGTVYYNTNTTSLPTETTISVPEEYTPIDDWSIIGYRDDTDDDDAEIAYRSSVTIPISAITTTYYAIYNRMYTAYFHNDVNGSAITKSGVGYYNTNTASLPTSWTITSPTADETYSVTNWTKLGFRDDTDNDVQECNLGGDCDVPFGYSDHYAVYSRTGSARFYHGINKASNIVITGTTYYNLGSSSGIPTTTTVTTPTRAQITDITGWTEVGYRDDTNNGSQEISFNISLTTVPLGTTTNYYTVYARTMTIYSGISSASVTYGAQYYNTDGVESDVSIISFPNISSTGSFGSTVGLYDGWGYVGWCQGLNNTTSVGNCAEGGAPITTGIAPSVTEGIPTYYYAVYKRNLRYTTGFVESSAVDSTVNQYYISSDSYAASMPTAATVSGWTLVGWTEDGSVTDNPSIGTSVTVYTGSSSYISSVYKRNVSCLAGVGAYDASVDTLIGTQYRSYSNSYYNVLPTTGLNTPSNWNFIGWNDEQTAVSPQYTSSSSSANFYAVFSRTKVISYDANGGSPTPSNTIKTIYIVASSDPYNLYASSTSATITNETPTYQAYSFKYWVSDTTPVQKVSPGGTLTFSYVSTDSNDYTEWFGDDSYWNVTMTAEY